VPTETDALLENNKYIKTYNLSIMLLRDDKVTLAVHQERAFSRILPQEESCVKDGSEYFGYIV
jgi:hypothetical protein